MAVLEADHVHYAVSTHFGLEDVCLRVKQGERVSIIGPNGSGKSTLLKLAARLLKPQHGVILLDGRDIAGMRGKDAARQITMLTQVQPQLTDMTVRDLVQFGRHPHSKMLSGETDEDRRVIEWAIAATRLEKLADRPLESLSGGERQRAWIAMTIAQQPSVLLLDEPTTYLDIANQIEVLELMNELNQQQHISIVMVLHDLNQAAQYSDHVVVMHQGSIVQQGLPQKVMTPQLLADVFGIEARIQQVDERLYILPLAVASANR